ncbi:methyltransferase family protein [Nocardia sp. NPDC056100]|uniref:methyltransferase family protein n=1 Tax=Nocardia sp. NPDC056100 TaxID=3345712 RepID=UPI0035D879B8
MRSMRAVWGSLLFTVLVPGTVAGFLPLWISGWHFENALPPTALWRVLGVLLIAAGLPILLGAIYRFAVEGLGTPAPVAPTAHLVVGGPNRFVRNPMYLAVVSMVLGQALLFGRVDLLWYAVIIAVGQALFVRFYEEPTLLGQFGAEYERYRAAVPAWVPRRTPWTPQSPA